MFADALNLIIAKKIMKENWKIKGKIIYKRDYYKVQIIANEGEITELKKESKLKISTKAVYLIRCCLVPLKPPTLCQIHDWD